MLEAWSVRMEGFEEKKRKRRWWFMRKIVYIMCAVTCFMCLSPCLCVWVCTVQYLHMDVCHDDERIWTILFSARAFLRDRKCVCDGKYLLTRYDKPPKHFQFWSIHIFPLSVGGWSPFVHRLHLFSYCAFAVSNSVSAFNFFFFSFFLRLYLLEPIFHYELTEKVKFLKLHVWICCCCCWCICRMHFMDGKSKHLIVWYYFWAVVCSRKAFDWSFFLLFGWYIFVYKMWLSN